MKRKLCIGVLILLLLAIAVSTVLGNGGKPPPSESPLPTAMPAAFNSPIGPPSYLSDYWLSVRELTLEYFVVDVGDDPGYVDYSLWVDVCEPGIPWCRDMTVVFTDTYFTGEMTLYWDDIPDQNLEKGLYVSWFWGCEPTQSWYACGFIDHWWIPYEACLPLVLRNH